MKSKKITEVHFELVLRDLNYDSMFKGGKSICEKSYEINP